MCHALILVAIYASVCVSPRSLPLSKQDFSPIFRPFALDFVLNVVVINSFIFVYVVGRRREASATGFLNSSRRSAQDNSK